MPLIPISRIDDQQQPWLVFGSFWSGMKLVKLNADLKQIAEPQEWYTVSKRARDFKTEDSNPGEGAVEAPFIYKKENIITSSSPSIFVVVAQRVLTRLW